MRIALSFKTLGLGFSGLGVVPVFGLGWVIYQRCKLRSLPFAGETQGPLIAFSGCFWLWGFYLGVTAYMLDNFDTSTCSFSSVSAGCNAMFAFMNSNKLGEAFAFSRYMLKEIEERQKGYLFIAQEEFRSWAYDFFVKGLGYTDQYIKDRTTSQRFLIAFTSINPPEFEQKIVSQFDSWNDLADYCVASMCVPPFWKGPIQFDNSEDFILDGGLSGAFCIPDEFRSSENYVQIDCIPNNDPQTVAPRKFFPVKWYFTPNNNLDIVLEQFRVGYSACAEQHDMLVEVGLKPKDVPNSKTLEDWIEQFRDIDQAINDGIYFKGAKTSAGTDSSLLKMSSSNAAPPLLSAYAV